MKLIKEQSLLRTVFIGRNTGSAGGLHRDFSGVCQTGRIVLRKGSQKEFSKAS